MAAAALQAKSDTADRARQKWRRQRMVPENSADRSVGRSWDIQYPSASMRPPRQEMERRLPADNAAPHFLPMMVRAPRAVDLLAKSAAPLPRCPKRRDKGTASWVRAGLPRPASHEQTANPDFASRLTARGRAPSWRGMGRLVVGWRARFSSYFRSSIPTFDKVVQAAEITEENAAPLGNLEAPRSPRPWLRAGASGRFLPTR